MKGIVFTEFLVLVEEKFGLDVVDHIIRDVALESKGVYTSVGTYKFEEMLALLTSLSALKSISINDLLHVYGLHFFAVLFKQHPDIFEMYKDPLDLLSSIEKHIHVHVRKIYPNAELPRFEVLSRTGSRLEMVYYSSRSMYSFALGLMENTFQHYNSSASITCDLIKSDGSEVKFVIVKDE
jgi:hypothetical protein